MATVNHYGPYIWVKPFGEFGFMPGETHGWVWGPSPSDGNITITAYSAGDPGVRSALAVENLFTSTAEHGAPDIHFNVRNGGRRGLLHYRMYISVIAF